MEPPNLNQKDKYLSIGTYRKNGELKRTAVWFVVYQDGIVIYTDRETWKVKRIMNNPQVRFAPCNARGGNLGEDFEGTAQLWEISDHKEVLNVFKKKYGLMFRFISWFDRKSDNVLLRITYNSVN